MVKINYIKVRRNQRGTLIGWDPVPLSSHKNGERIKSMIFLVGLGKRGRR